MRVFLCIVVLLGTPFYIWNEITTGTFDMGTTAILLFLCACAIGGLMVVNRKMQVAKGQEDFYLSQRK